MVALAIATPYIGVSLDNGGHILRRTVLQFAGIAVAALVLIFAAVIAINGLKRTSRIAMRAAKVYATDTLTGSLKEVCIYYSDEFDQSTPPQPLRSYKCVTTCIPVLEKAEMTCGWEVVSK